MNSPSKIIDLFSGTQRLLRRVGCLLVLAGTILAADAQPKKGRFLALFGAQKFRLDNTVFISTDFEHRSVSTEMAKWLRSEGVAASNAFHKARNRISFVKVASVPGAKGSDAWQIEVKAKRVTVAFTTETALQNAIAALQGMLEQDEAGRRYFPAGTRVDWGVQHQPQPKREAVADAATAMRSVDELETVLKQLSTKSGEVYLMLVSTDKWRMQCPSLEAARLTDRLYSTDGYYNTRQLEQLAATAKRSRIEVIPTLELLHENKPFTEAFGHSVFSVEGMRLVRAAIEDCIDAMHPNKICIGTLSPNTDMRYLEFISSLASMLEVELVIIES